MPFRTERIVEFAETDLAGIVHFSNYFRWMEWAEHAFFRSLDLPLIEKEESIIKGWPRRQVSCQFKKPLRFQDIVIVELAVADITAQAVCYEFSFYKRKEDGQELLVAKGEMTTVCVAFSREEGSLRACSISDTVCKRLKEQLKIEISA